MDLKEVWCTLHCHSSKGSSPIICGCRILRLHLGRGVRCWLVDWVLWHINLCRLFNAKSIFIYFCQNSCIYITIQFSVSSFTVKTVNFQAIQFSISTQFKCKYSLIIIQNFHTPWLVASRRLTKYSLPYYLLIAGGRIIVLIPFPRVLVLCEMK